MARRGPQWDMVSVGDTTSDAFLALGADAVMERARGEDRLCLSYADKIPVSRVTHVVGVGNAANQAVGSSRLGLSTAIWTVLGDDVDGRETVGMFRKEGVGTDAVILDRRGRTNYSVVLNTGAERTILTYHHPRRYRFPRLPAARWLYLTSMGASWPAILPALVRYVRRTGVRIGFNPGTHQLRAPAAVLRRVLHMTHVLLLNTEEAGALLGDCHRRPQDLLRGLAARGPAVVVITDGPRGAYARAGDASWFVPHVPARAVERTGAGDAFSAGVLAALARARPLPEALVWGAVNAASVVQHVGARTGLLRRREMDAWVRAVRLRPRPL